MRNHRLAVLSASLALTALLSAAAPVRADVAAAGEPVKLFVNAGSGLPEILHASVGTFLGPHVSVGARLNFTLFNPMVGLEAMYAIGTSRGPRSPRHALVLGASATINPTLGGFELSGQGEEIAAAVSPSVGYAFLTDGHFFFRALAAVIVYHQRGAGGGFEAGPSLSVGAGFTL
jgi:hypothetical protein